jgi:hypothetical protein
MGRSFFSKPAMIPKSDFLGEKPTLLVKALGGYVASLGNNLYGFHPLLGKPVQRFPHERLAYAAPAGTYAYTN